MHPREIARAVVALAAAALAAPALAQSADRCVEPKPGVVPIFAPAVEDVVTGRGRLQFYSAPNPYCALDGVFVVPKDELIEYARTYDGWSSVMYIGDGSLAVLGWVRSARLKIIGTMGPRQ